MNLEPKDPNIAPNTEIEASTQPEIQPELAPPPPTAQPEPAETRFLKAILFGEHGVRAGWMVVLFLVLTVMVAGLTGLLTTLALKNLLHLHTGKFTPVTSIIQETISVLGVLGAAAICTLIERRRGRRLSDYYLRGPRRTWHFLVGSLAGVAALSLLVGALYEGHWLQFGAISLSGIQIWKFGVLWGIAFVLTGFFEEGSARCYMLFTLARGINYWWALGTVATLSLLAAINPHGNGSGGVYVMAGLGVLPCLRLHSRKAPSVGFWCAAWVTSTFFGYIHTFNDGETWIGIFSAAFIGFIFCVSIRLTGSVWWAMGFHASWDWAQTFFYGTADSGFLPQGHYLTTNPAGPILWSGGSDGPEGSLLVIPVTVLVLLALVVVYGRKKQALEPEPAQQQLAA